MTSARLCTTSHHSICVRNDLPHTQRWLPAANALASSSPQVDRLCRPSKRDNQHPVSTPLKLWVAAASGYASYGFVASYAARLVVPSQTNSGSAATRGGAGRTGLAGPTLCCGPPTAPVTYGAAKTRFVAALECRCAPLLHRLAPPLVIVPTAPNGDRVVARPQSR